MHRLRDHFQREADTAQIAERLIKIAQAIVLVLDPSARVLFYNPYFEQLSGMPLDEAIGADWFTTFLPTRDHQRIRTLFERALAGEPVVDNLNPIVTRSGEEREIEWSGAFLQGDDGKTVGVLSVGIDVTERDVASRLRAERRLAESERKYRAIFEQRHQLAAILGVDGTVVDVNRRALDLAGASKADVEGRRFWETVWWSHSTELQARLRDAIERGARGESVRFDVEHPRADGTTAIVDFSLRPIIDQRGGVEMLIPEGVDITEQRRLEHALAERERLATIGATASMFAHEIGNPLNNMSLHGSLLARRLRAKDADTDLLQPLGHMLDELKRLGALLEEFRGLAKRHRLLLAPTDLRELVDEIVQAYVAPEGAAWVRVERDLPDGMPKVPANADKLKQVLLNLCKNAIEAMPDGGILRFEGSFTDNVVELRVKDSGGGLPTDVDVFQPFETTKANGTGLGLPIARHIVRSHGGELTCQSDAGKGSTFTVTLPRTASPPSDPPPP